MLDATAETSTLRIRPINGRIGALIEGIQLSGRLPDDQVRAIHDAVLRHKVVFLRDQSASDRDRQDFAELLGEPIAPSYADDPSRADYAIDSGDNFRSDHWHSDMSWELDFVSLGILSPVQLSEVGGETIWSNMAAAYQDLPDPVKAMADQLWAVHSAQKPVELTFHNPTVHDVERGRIFKGHRGTRHPVVRIHPDTGERVLLLGNIVHWFEGLERTPGQHVYELLHHYASRPENTLRWHWRMGDVAIWDNRATLHYGVRDYGDQRRVLRRISLKGTVPVGIDGRRSERVE